MSLYFVRHQHSAETCPAKESRNGADVVATLNQTKSAQVRRGFAWRCCAGWTAYAGFDR